MMDLYLLGASGSIGLQTLEIIEEEQRFSSCCFFSGK